MFGWTKKSKKEIEEIQEDDIKSVKTVDTTEEQELAAMIIKDFEDSRAVREGETDETGLSIEDMWEDEYKLYKGRLQWVTTFAYRSRAARKNRPNSEDNFIFNTIEVQKANITANIPDINISGTEDQDKEIAEKLTYMSRFNDGKNRFQEIFKKWVHDFCTSGPTIAMVLWDEDWIGGKGEKRWNGDIRLLRVDKDEMFFDPSIIDLENDMQECSYIIRRIRKKLSYIKGKWPKGNEVVEDWDDDEYINEGANPDQSYLIEYWHRGFPHFVPEQRKKELLNESAKFEEKGDVYRAKDYKDAAEGTLEGIHVAYYSGNVLLEYCPYEYEDGLYPFVFTTKYYDEKCQWGFGEIRNIAIPQIMHNKADEMEIEAMCKEGLGGYYYQKGAISRGQLNKILENSGKGGQFLEVDNLSGMKAREGSKVPAATREYKQNKERIINSIQPATTIQQGISPGSNVPFATVQDLGNRSDVRMKQVSDKLEDFLIRVNELRINRFAQFYTDERYYRIKGNDNKIKEGTLKSDDMEQKWEREPAIYDVETGMLIKDTQEEFFVPDFDIKITIMSEKPTDRGYYTQLASALYDKQLLSPEDLFFTLEEGKMPPMEDVLKHMYARQPIMEVMSKIQELPEQTQQYIMDTLKQAIGQAQQQVQIQGEQEQMMEQQQGGNN